MAIMVKMVRLIVAIKCVVGVQGAVEKMKSKKQSKKPWHWPFLRINFGGDKEYMCEHGIGHSKGEWPHGCDNCCSDPNFPKEK